MTKELDINKLVRSNIKALTPYSSARDEFSGDGAGYVFLDANENPNSSTLFNNNTLNRYPDPLQLKLKEGIASLKGCRTDELILGNGSDELIDLLIRSFCEPQRDNIIILPPTYGMYAVCADINAVEIKEVPLTSAFQIDVGEVLKTIDSNTKLIFICSPNNPTGNLMALDAIKQLLIDFDGLVIVDEAYIDFCIDSESLISLLNDYENLFILQTFSKAWGLAGIRLGMGFGSLPVIDILNKVKPPYNVNALTIEYAQKALSNVALKEQAVTDILNEKKKLIDALKKLDFVQNIFPSDANFILVKLQDAQKIYQQLLNLKIVVRDRSNVLLCDGCLRITIGTAQENEKLLLALRSPLK